MRRLPEKWCLEKMEKDWINRKFEVYLDPLYYEEILPPYRFGDKSDEEILESYLQEQTTKQGHKFKLALELGCGSGRGTRILKKYCQRIIAVDLNKQMLKCLSQYRKRLLTRQREGYLR